MASNQRRGQPEKTALSAHLELVRADRDQNLTEAAEALGVTIVTLRSWVQGTTRPSPSSYAAIATYLEVTEKTVEKLLSIPVTEVTVAPEADLPARAIASVIARVENDANLAHEKDFIQLLREVLAFGVVNYQPPPAGPSAGDAGP